MLRIWDYDHMLMDGGSNINPSRNEDVVPPDFLVASFDVGSEISKWRRSQDTWYPKKRTMELYPLSFDTTGLVSRLAGTFTARQPVVQEIAWTQQESGSCQRLQAPESS